MENTKKTGPINQENSYELMEIELAAQGLHGSAPGPQHLWFPVKCFFGGTPGCANEWVSDFSAVSWALFLLLVCIAQL